MKTQLMLCMFALALLVLTGCGNKAVYQNLQHNKKQECKKQPAAEYDSCMQGMDQRYDEYERQRQHMTKK